MKSIKKVDCPTCGKNFHLINGHQVGDQIQCPYCEDLLEIKKLKPLIVEWIYSIDYAISEEWDFINFDELKYGSS